MPTPARTNSVSFAGDGRRFIYEASETLANVQKLAFDPMAETVRGEPVPVTSGTRTWADVDVATDGRLTFWSTFRTQDVYVSSGDGSSLTALAPDAALDRFVRWSPDGTRIAFSSMKGEHGNFEVFTIRPDGRDLQRVTFIGGKYAAFFPLWSPDGTRLAFTAAPLGGGQTYLIDMGKPWPSGGPKPWLTPPGDLDLRYRPWSWSPDGRSIIAYSERGAGMIVYSTQTGAHTRVSEIGEKPRWLSDSRRVIYVDSGRLSLLDTVSRRTRRLFSLGGESVNDPAITRDDRTIYFIRGRSDGDLWMATLAPK